MHFFTRFAVDDVGAFSTLLHPHHPLPRCTTPTNAWGLGPRHGWDAISWDLGATLRNRSPSSPVNLLPIAQALAYILHGILRYLRSGPVWHVGRERLPPGVWARTCLIGQVERNWGTRTTTSSLRGMEIALLAPRSPRQLLHKTN